MKLVDLRPYGHGIDTEILEITTREIVFGSYKKLGENYYYSLMIYNIDQASCLEIYSYELEKDSIYSQYIHLIDGNIVIVKTHNPRELEIDIIDRLKGDNKRSYSIKVEEEVSSIPIFINEDYLVFYTEVEDLVYLYDLPQARLYPIRDPRLIEGMGVEHGRMEKFPLFSHKDEDYLVFNESYMDDWEYEEVYEYALENKMDKNSFTSEALYYIRLEDFISAIKSGQEKIPFRLIRRKTLDGWVRYISSHRNYIYYRDKDFLSQKEKIIAIDKSSLETRTIKEIDHSNISGNLVYDSFSSGLRIYEDKSKETLVELRGIYNFPRKVEFSMESFPDKYRGGYSLFQLIENRFLIASGWYEDELEDYYDIYYIKDLSNGESSQLIGKNSIFENVLVVSESSVF